MVYRQLGSTGVEISEISIGMEQLEFEDRRIVIDTVRRAVDNGVNFFDLVVVRPEPRDSVGAALRGIRNKVMISGHLGSYCKDGNYARTRDLRLCEASIHDLLARLHTDHVDILMLHFVDEEDDYRRIFDPQGLLSLAVKLKKEGMARFVALSTHVTSIGLKAVQSGFVDAIMFPVNPAHDLLPGDIGLSATWKVDTYELPSENPIEPDEKRKELYLSCQQQGVGLIAMKPYAGGLLLQNGSLTKYVDSRPDVHSGDLSPVVGIKLSAVQCLSYVLSQPGISTALPGCRNPEEVGAALSYLEATPAERDYSGIDANALWKVRGRCVYCNHCLPCPVGIDIGALIKILDAAECSIDNAVKEKYIAHNKNASDCTRCGVCVERCPFGVPVVDRMERAIEVFAGVDE